MKPTFGENVRRASVRHSFSTRLMKVATVVQFAFGIVRCRQYRQRRTVGTRLTLRLVPGAMLVGKTVRTVRSTLVFSARFPDDDCSYLDRYRSSTIAPNSLRYNDDPSLTTESPALLCYSSVTPVDGLQTRNNFHPVLQNVSPTPT